MTELAGIIFNRFRILFKPERSFLQEPLQTMNALVSNLFAHFPKYVRVRHALV